MFRKFIVLLTVYLLLRNSSLQKIDFNICPNGLTPLPSDSRWPKILPNHFEIFTELTTDIEAFEITQIFLGSYYDVIYFRNYEKILQIYFDFQINEMLTINEEFICYRSDIGSQESLPFITSEFLKPSILLGFNGRNNYNQIFSTRYIGKEIVRNGILTNKFQSCFFLEQQNLTINATYYLSELPPNEININIAPDIIQIDVQTNNYPYTYNIIRYESNPSLTITTPSGTYCPNRINKKEFPQNLPSHFLFHAEAYTLKTKDIPEKIDSYNRLIDEQLEFERIDYGLSNMLIPSRLLLDYSTHLSYMYILETQQCIVMNISNYSMGTINERLFQFNHQNNSIQYQYTGLYECEREHVLCHRWIGQYDTNTSIQQYEWYWSAKYNEIDLNELIPIKVNLKTIFKNESQKIINQEINIFNYNPSPNSIEAIDSTLAECYRALGPNHHFNYAILRLILNNDIQYPIHRYLLSFENAIHLQLSNDLKIRHIRLSSFVIDIIKEQEKDISVTFTLLDNPPNSSNELSSLELIRQLTQQINNGKFFVRINDGAFELQARPNSLRTLVLYLLPSENHTNYFNETIFIYQNITQTIITRREKLIYKYIGSQIAALSIGFALFGLLIALGIGSFIAIRKWSPTIHNHRI